MPTLSSPGVGSGLDVSGIVSKLMAIERRPLTALNNKNSVLQSQLSAFGQLKSAVSNFQDTLTNLADGSKFKAFTATSSTATVATATADANAAKGTFVIQVNRVAERHRMVAGTVVADADKTTMGAAGTTMTISVGSTKFTVATGGLTLDQIRTAINGAGDNAGVTASTLQDNSGFHLTLTANNTGSKDLLQAEYSGADLFGLTTINSDRDQSGAFAAADLDAEFKVENTFTITRSSNTVGDVFAGVSLNLVAAGTTTLQIERDDSKITSAVQQFIAGYNSVFKTSATLRSSQTAERAALFNIEDQFRSVLHAKGNNSAVISRLADLGIASGKDGTLTLNTSMFQAALTKDPAAVTSLFSNPITGIAVRFKALATDLVSGNGALGHRAESTRTAISNNDKAIANLQFRLTKKETTLNQQYTKLDSLLATLNSTSSYLTTQLAQIESISNPKK